MTSKEMEFPVSRLVQLLDYDPQTGRLTWKQRHPSDFPTLSPEANCLTWNKKFAGTQAMATVNARGYCHGTLGRRTFSAHRVAMAIALGHWPVGQVDHVNGIRTDNRISNLRVVSNSENSRNSSVKPSNKSGVTGVFWSKETGKWAAQICVNGKGIHLGLFTEKDAAAQARRDAEVLHGFHPLHGKRRLGNDPR